MPTEVYDDMALAFRLRHEATMSTADLHQPITRTWRFMSVSVSKLYSSIYASSR